MQNKNDNQVLNNVIALIPCAGRATRLPSLPCSKEIYPLGLTRDVSGTAMRSRLVCDSLFEQLRAAGITDAYLILREGKWDIPSCLGDGSSVGMRLAYLMMGLPYGVPYTIDQAFPFVRDRLVALGFPDIVFESANGFRLLLDRQRAGQAELVVGFFPADRPHKCDMIDVDSEGRLQRIVIKPQQTDLVYTWGIAVWTPVFGRFMHEFLRGHRESARGSTELFLGDVFRAAIESGMRADAVPISSEPYLDIGTEDDLRLAIRRGVVDY